MVDGKLPPNSAAWLVLYPREQTQKGYRSTRAGSPRRRYTDPNRASIRSHAGRTRTRTISSAVTVVGVQAQPLRRGCRLRQETHCGQGEYAAHRNADAGRLRS